MKAAATSRSRKISVRSKREDGEETKARITEVAGRLFAERGFAEVTSKEICEAAGTNLTAVNYHFGSREGLYIRVLEEMSQHFHSPDFYAELGNNGNDARTNLDLLMDQLIANVYERDSWQIQLWARELVSPSQFGRTLMEEEALPRFEILEGLLSDITGVPRGSIPLKFCFLNVMSPFLVLLIMSGRGDTPENDVLRLGQETVGRHLKEIVFSGLKDFAARYAAGEIDMCTTIKPQEIP